MHEAQLAAGLDSSPRTTRLCIVLGGHWEAQMGGAQYQAKCLLDVLSPRSNFETYYLAQHTPHLKKRDGYQIVQFGSPNEAGAIGVLASLPSLYRALRKLRPDVVYQRCLMPYTGLCALYCARHGARFVFHVASEDDVRRPRRRGMGPRAWVRRLSRSIGEYGVRHAHAIVAQTSDQARILRAQYGLEVTTIVPNFQPPPSEPGPARNSNRLRVIWVGNFKPVKRAEIFVDLAAAFAGDSGVQFVMIGRAGEAARYADLHRRMQQLPNLEYLGELPLERVNREIAASDLLVNTSAYEGFPNTFIQGWLRGVPALSCVVDPEGCLTQAGAGLLVGGLEGLSAAIAELRDDRAKLKRLAERAREYGYANHLPSNADRLVHLLRAQHAHPD